MGGQQGVVQGNSRQKVGWLRTVSTDTRVSLPRSPPVPQLPASFFAYRKQQHRWTCGPIQLWSKASADIWRAQVCGAPGGEGCEM